jgi:hypothetical protein
MSLSTLCLLRPACIVQGYGPEQRRRRWHSPMLHGWSESRESRRCWWRFRLALASDERALHESLRVGHRPLWSLCFAKGWTEVLQCTSRRRPSCTDSNHVGKPSGLRTFACGTKTKEYAPLWMQMPGRRRTRLAGSRSDSSDPAGHEPSSEPKRQN